MDRSTYYKNGVQRIACTPLDRVRLEHAGWRPDPDPSFPAAAPATDDAGPASADAGVSTGDASAVETAPEPVPETAGPPPARRRSKTSS
ncbi:hypothetical protein [Actinomadura rudentiformis]|uniref:Uncharacterized protein n=1 Tax=Actinomadura rudentiformis TaxID=359158 RepID=A0A6H9YPW4_9ACTN|nr:hypothetical protein [Actinomadura rudentiformis]KAB2344881.1 hypothetical protein F8566_30290 [Actinomadura rudentiformis]